MRTLYELWDSNQRQIVLPYPGSSHQQTPMVHFVAFCAAAKTGAVVSSEVWLSRWRTFFSKSMQRRLLPNSDFERAIASDDFLAIYFLAFSADFASSSNSRTNSEQRVNVQPKRGKASAMVSALTLPPSHSFLALEMKFHTISAFFWDHWCLDGLPY